jgi:cytosine permease
MDLNNSTEDFSRAPVASEATVGPLRLLMVLMGSKVALSSFLVGARLMTGLGMRDAIVATIVGGLVLACISVPSAVAGARSRLSTYMLIVAAFGTTGGKVVNSLIALTVLGWFGVIATMLGQSITELAGAGPSSPVASAWLLTGCILVIVTAVVGFKALDWLSMITMPLKFLLLGWMLWAVLKNYSVETLTAIQATRVLELPQGIAVVVGTVVAGALLQPDVCRFARTPRGAATASLLTFAIGTPVVLLLAGLPGLATGHSDLVPILTALDLGISALLILLLSAWTMNTFNLYAGSLIFSTIFTSRPRWQLALAAGALGTLLALLGIGERLVSFLLILSVCIPPIAAVYLAEFYFGSSRRYIGEESAAAPKWRLQSLLVCALGIALTAVGARTGVSLTGIAPLDSLIVTTLMWGGCRLIRRDAYGPALPPAGV